MKKLVITTLLTITLTTVSAQIMGGGQISTDGEGCTWVNYPDSDPILIDCDPNYGQTQENDGCSSGYWTVRWISFVPYPVWVANC